MPISARPAGVVDRAKAVALPLSVVNRPLSSSASLSRHPRRRGSCATTTAWRGRLLRSSLMGRHGSPQQFLRQWQWWCDGARIGVSAADGRERRCCSSGTTKVHRGKQTPTHELASEKRHGRSGIWAMHCAGGLVAMIQGRHGLLRPRGPRICVSRHPHARAAGRLDLEGDAWSRGRRSASSGVGASGRYDGGSHLRAGPTLRNGRAGGAGEARTAATVGRNVEWRPGGGRAEHELLSAGFDMVLKLWDLRKPPLHQGKSGATSGTHKALREFRGHIPPPAASHAFPKLKNITRPRFLGPTGAAIAVCGDTTHHLTLFDTSGATITSRGLLDDYATSVIQVSEGGDGNGVSVAVAEASGRIKILRAASYS